MALQQLTPEWQVWVRENVARGCSLDAMLPLMQQGGYAKRVAEQAIADAQGSLLTNFKPLAPAGQSASASALAAQVQERSQASTPATTGDTAIRPWVDLSDNQIQLSDGQRVRIAAVLDHPQVVLFEGLLSTEECQAMMDLAETRLTRSTVVDEQLGEARPHEHRTSAGGFFQRGEHELVARIEARIAELLHWPVENGEGLQVLRYGVGGEYRAHFDYFNPAHPGSERHLKTGGQRVGTCILYLDEVEAGGGTRFPSLGYEVRPMRGAALYFANIDAQGVEDPATLHAGVPVSRGVKYISTKWLRQRRYG